MKGEVYERKMDAQDELLARILNAAARIKKREGNSHEQHAIFAQDLQSELWLTVGFSNIYCEV
jgi:hypothetical protein